MFIEEEKVFTTFRPPTAATQPIMGRKYMITHSDDTGELYVTIGPAYAEDMVGELRDEVRMTWTMLGDNFVLLGEVLVSDPEFEENSKIRNEIFTREIPKALSAMRYGDRKLFEAFPALDKTPILVQFNSNLEEYHKLYHYGYVEDYK